MKEFIPDCLKLYGSMVLCTRESSSLLLAFTSLVTDKRRCFIQNGYWAYENLFENLGNVAPDPVKKEFIIISFYHYYRFRRFLRESFDTLVQYRSEQVNENHVSMSMKHCCKDHIYIEQVPTAIVLNYFSLTDFQKL